MHEHMLSEGRTHWFGLQDLRDAEQADARIVSAPVSNVQTSRFRLVVVERSPRLLDKYLQLSLRCRNADAEFPVD